MIPYNFKANLTILKMPGDCVLSPGINLLSLYPLFSLFSFFGFILIMRRLLKLEEFTEMKAQILELNGKYPFVDMRYYGFPKGWDGLL